MGKRTPRTRSLRQSRAFRRGRGARPAPARTVCCLRLWTCEHLPQAEDPSLCDCRASLTVVLEAYSSSSVRRGALPFSRLNDVPSPVQPTFAYSVSLSLGIWSLPPPGCCDSCRSERERRNLGDAAFGCFGGKPVGGVPGTQGALACSSSWLTPQGHVHRFLRV